MSLPAGMNYKTVVGKIADIPDGGQRSVNLRCNEWLFGPAAGSVVPPFSLTPVEIEDDGSFTLQVPASDDPAWQPASGSFFLYRVLINVDGQVLEGSLSVPLATVEPIDLATSMNPDQDGGAAGATYLLAASRGAPGGVAALDSDGDVTDASGAKIVGGGGGGSTAWAAITGKPSTFPPTLPIAQSGVTSLASDLAARPTNSAVTSAIAAAVAPKADTSALAGYVTTAALTTALAPKANTADLGAKVITLAVGAPVPGGTAVGTVIVRY